MQDKLRALVRLAEIDNSARDTDEQLRGIPEELEERRAAVQALEALVGGQRGQLEEAKALLESQIEDLKLRNDMLARARAKSAKARNMREAQMAERELESVRRSIGDGEQERDRLQGLIDQIGSILEKPLTELEEQKTALTEAEASSGDKLTTLEAEKAEITKGRDEHVAKIPKPIYRRYERIRPKIHPAVVEAVDGYCTGCRMRIAPQLYNQIIAGTDFHQCQACNRFLFHKDAIL